ncbi:hypothetical protein F4776DRAFT_669454 [Hypoxylon sp. NC0597]|nr:hypothetical protein F4776DRAFT_669454 [Hypoxylon sp. NC0597]
MMTPTHLAPLLESSHSASYATFGPKPKTVIPLKRSPPEPSANEDYVVDMERITGTNDSNRLWLAKPAYEIIDSIWAEFLERLRLPVSDTLSELLPFLEDVMPNLASIKEQVKGKMRRALKNISKYASNGTFKHRETLLIEFAKSSGQRMFNAAFETLRKQLHNNFDRLPGVLGGISVFAIEAVKDLITALLNNVALPSDFEVDDALKEKFKLQKRTRQVLMQWDLEWKVPETASDHLLKDKGVALPDEYLPMECDSEEDEDEMDLDEASSNESESENT